VSPLIVLYKLHRVSIPFYCDNSELTLHSFLQPPPLSSAAFGGLHFQDHSNDTDWLPPVPKSPTSCTFAFLCKLGSAWNSRVTKVSTSLAVEADTYVRPFTVVSTRLLVSWAPFIPGVVCCVCRIIKVKLKVSSSSLLSLRMKLGDGPGDDGSGSYVSL